MILDTTRSEVSLAPSGVSHSQPVCMIVEDQPLIGFALEAYLEEAGFGTCEVFRSAAETLAWLATHTPTVAVLDFSLQDGPCTTLTGVLVERGIPFVIYSGHKRSIAPCELQHVPWISKPCDREVLLAALTRAAPALSTWSTGIQPQERTILLQRGWPFVHCKKGGAGAMHYECRECGSPAITLPERLDGNAYVLCRDCHSPVATWAVFKRTTTQAVLADFREMGAGSHPISYDPLDPSLLHVVEGRL